jgi:hypothetical protein
MDLETPARVADIVSGLAVVVSLVYLGLQVRQNTRALRAATYNAVTANSVAILAPMYANAEFTEYLDRMQSRPESATSADKLRFHLNMLTAFRHWDNLYYQHRHGMLEPEMWQGYDRTMTGWVANAAWREWFQDNARLFSDSLQSLVQERIAAQ